MKFYNYLLDLNAHVELKAIATPEFKETTIKAIFEHVLEHEKMVTKSIHDLHGNGYRGQGFCNPDTSALLYRRAG